MFILRSASSNIKIYTVDMTFFVDKQDCIWIMVVQSTKARRQELKIWLATKKAVIRSVYSSPLVQRGGTKKKEKRKKKQKSVKIIIKMIIII